MAMNVTMNGTHDSLEDRLLEAFDLLWNDFVDPRDAYFDSDGWWAPVGGKLGAAVGIGTGPFNEQSLAELRLQCRRLAASRCQVDLPGTRSWFMWPRLFSVRLTSGKSRMAMTSRLTAHRMVTITLPSSVDSTQWKLYVDQGVGVTDGVGSGHLAPWRRGARPLPDNLRRRAVTPRQRVGAHPLGLLPLRFALAAGAYDC